VGGPPLAKEDYLYGKFPPRRQILKKLLKKLGWVLVATHTKAKLLHNRKESFEAHPRLGF
jgi:hypothetical protein